MAKKQQQEFAVIGLGRFGSSLARALEENGQTVMAIDIDPQLVQSIADEVTHAATLDATNEDALRAIDITAFDTVIVAIGADFEANLITTATLKDLGVRRIICKTQSNRQKEILLRIGADKVVQPEQNSARRLAEELSLPTLLEKFNLTQSYSIAEILLPASLNWQSLAQTDLRNKYQLTVLLIKRGDEVLISPTSDTVLQEGDLLIVFGDNPSITQFSKLP
ncbi:MAG: TrkA family potassium uptake protein [Chloroflexi bacterium]|jgi:trk system potassium uptake protein TrkA|nr:TrkA family potassium uptake protein [Chloroflexota bacterium]MBK6711364.1 TrkA family potassium uptake protein [Chloroflexota bacterium]MBK7176365.1 TrkA family potassium uptake protein [Chloroflexota bacterium]MBK8931265.1 TrkA family potassium uptake protein [Chloroflexota bacterium]MBP7591405.1 TrkA family potassium uptake protein [Chloroflexota bacterium]